MNNKFINILVALGIAFALEAILFLVFKQNPDSRVLILLGGKLLGGGYIQFIMYFLFIFGMFENLRLSKYIKRESKAFDLHVLPEKENWVLAPNDVLNLKLDVQNKNQRANYVVLNLITQVARKYQTNKSTSEAQDVLTEQTRIKLSEAESEQGMIRYAAWAIPSVGFIGTIIGIAGSLGAADQATTAEGISTVTSKLNVAFDTTLIALILSLFLMLAYHLLQQKTENFHSRMESYILENLVNRIYNR